LILLRKKSKKIAAETIKTRGIQKFIADLKATMLKSDGVGLAAPQVDQLMRLIIVNSKEGPIAMINPKITAQSFLKVWGEEGCLSVPLTFGQVKRHKKLTCEFLDEKGDKKTIEAAGLMARIIQHEIDHLNGVLFIDIAKKIKKLEPKN